MTSEAPIRDRIRLAVAGLGARLFRNSIGLCRCRGTPITYGLGEGTADLVGWLPITVTPALLGKRLSVFVAVEVKTPGTATTKKQIAFLEAVRKAGGIALVAHSEADVLDALNPHADAPDP